jgi:hypothetical protein
MLRSVFKIVGLLIACMVALVVLLWFFRLVHFIFSMAVGLLLLAGIFYLISYLFKIGVNTTVEKTESYRLFDYTQAAVALFAGEPSVADLLAAQNMSQRAQGASEPGICTIDNDTQVIVLADEKDKDAVRVRVANGQQRGREGWVCRSVLHKSSPEKLLPGQS